jgi:amino acid transporter
MSESRKDTNGKSVIVGVAVIVLVLLVVMGLWWFKFKREAARSVHRQRAEPHDRKSEGN